MGKGTEFRRDKKETGKSKKHFNTLKKKKKKERNKSTTENRQRKKKGGKKKRTTESDDGDNVRACPLVQNETSSTKDQHGAKGHQY